MAPDERGPEGDGASNDNSGRAPDRTPRADPPPPGFLDLGGGQLFGGGTADDFRAAADWLARNYPEHSQDPPTGSIGPIYNMLIHHFRPGEGFLIIPNGTVRDERLSLAARGMLGYLLSRGSEWDTNADKESKRAQGHRGGKRGDGRDAMRRIFKELKEAGYLHERWAPRPGGRLVTEQVLFNRPVTDEEFRLDSDAWFTDSPVNQSSAPPAETPPPEDDWFDDATDHADTFSQVAPTYGSPGVGQPGVGSPGVGQPGVYKNTIHRGPDVEDSGARVGDGVDDWGVRGNHPRHQEDDDQGQDQEPAALRLPQAANSQKPASSRLNDQPLADDERRFPSVDPDSTTTGSCARASGPDSLSNGHRVSNGSPQAKAGGAAAPLSEPAKTAASDAMRLGRWKSPQQIAAEQAAESRAQREAAQRQGEAAS